MDLDAEERSTEKNFSIMKTPYQQTFGRVRVYGQLSPSLAVSSCVRPISPFFCNFSMDDLFRKSFDGVSNCNVVLLPGSRIADLDCADNAALLEDDPQVHQATLNHSPVEVTMYEIHFVSSSAKCFSKTGREILLHLLWGTFRNI